MNKIDTYEVSKVCIALTGFDPYILTKHISPMKIKRFEKEIENIKLKNNNEEIQTELDVIQRVREISKTPRVSRDALLYLNIALQKQVITGEVFDVLRKELGISEISPETDKYLQENWRREYQDPYEMLRGSQPFENNLEKK